MSVMIETDNLGRYFGPIKAVDGISFQVKKGEVLGFLGPNGAGKSTTMKMLACFLTPSFGTARVGDYDVQQQSREVRQVLGYLPENAPLYGEMTVTEFLRFVAEVREIASSLQKTALDRAIELCSLDDVVHQRIETLSKGFRRRVGLAQAIIHDPEILILDEPTDGLDPNQKHEVRSLINSMAKEKCVVLSTHILEEVDAVCTRMVVIANGKIVADDAPETLKRRSASFGAVTLRLSDGGDEDIKSSLLALAGVKRLIENSTRQEGLSYTLYPEKEAVLLDSVIREAQSRQWKIEELRTETGQLDEVFREITQGGGSDESL